MNEWGKNEQDLDAGKPLPPLDTAKIGAALALAALFAVLLFSKFT